MRLRRRLPPELEDAFAAFRDVVEILEPAKAQLTRVLPTTRLPGIPLVDALHDYETGLERAAGRMPAWRTPETEGAWRACDAGLLEARARARRLREEAPDLGGFEGVIWAVEQLLDPLDPFADAARAFHDRRR